MGHTWAEMDPAGARRQNDKLTARKKYVDRGWDPIHTGQYHADELFACPRCKATVKWTDLDVHTAWHEDVQMINWDED